MAGGTGHTTTPVSPPATQAAATLAVWDAFSGAWVPLAMNNSSDASPGPLSYDTASAAEAMRYLDDRQNVNVAVLPTQGRGAGAVPAMLGVDYMELTVSYQQ